MGREIDGKKGQNREEKDRWRGGVGERWGGKGFW